MKINAILALSVAVLVYFGPVSCQEKVLTEVSAHVHFLFIICLITDGFVSINNDTKEKMNTLFFCAILVQLGHCLNNGFLT